MYRLLRILLITLSCLLLPSCHVTTSVHDGNILRHLGQDVYWVAEDFPLLLLVDDQMPVEHLEATIDAGEVWNEAVGTRVFDIRIVDFSRAISRTHGVVSVSIKELGLTDRDTEIYGLHRGHHYPFTSHRQYSWVWYDEDLPDSLLERVMVHELGHALALAHDHNDRGSVMYPTISVSSGPRDIQLDDIYIVLGMVLDDR